MRESHITGVGTRFALHCPIETKQTITMSSIATMSLNPLFLRHDLMIELGRLEMAIDSARSREPANDAVNQLESRCAKINEALSQLPA